MPIEKGTHQIAEHLLNRIFTTTALKNVSQTLEALTQNQTFKQHASSIVSDAHLTDAQKRTQLLYLLRGQDHEVIYEFFCDELNPKHLWLFHAEKIDYFDHFVQIFQRLTETVRIIHLTTVVPLTMTDLRTIAADFSKSLGYQIIVDHEINTAILGGIQARLDNLVFDYSLRSRFREFEREWLHSLRTIETTATVPPHSITLK